MWTSSWGDTPVLLSRGTHEAQDRAGIQCCATDQNRAAAGWAVVSASMASVTALGRRCLCLGKEKPLGLEDRSQCTCRSLDSLSSPSPLCHSWSPTKPHLKWETLVTWGSRQRAGPPCHPEEKQKCSLQGILFPVSFENSAGAQTPCLAWPCPIPGNHMVLPTSLEWKRRKAS